MDQVVAQTVQNLGAENAMLRLELEAVRAARDSALRQIEELQERDSKA